MSADIVHARVAQNIRQLDLESLLLSGIGVVDFDCDSLAPFPPICAGGKGAGLKR